MDAEARRYFLYGCGVAILLPTLALLGANAADFIAFNRAVARAKRLTPTEQVALGDFCRTATQHTRFDATYTPPAFKALKPISGSLFPGCCDALLYERGQVYLWLRVETSPSNQRILYFTNSAGPQTSATIWERSPEFTKRMSPGHRLVTLTQWSLHERLEWVVLEDRICVYARETTVGGEDKLLATSPLTPENRTTIIAAIDAVKSKIGGLDFRAPVADGITLRIHFTPTGDSGSDDIVISNVWTDFAGPLVEAVERLAPREPAFAFRAAVTCDPDVRNRPCEVHTLRQMEKLQWPPPETPWWCVWRTIARWFTS